MPVFFSTRWFGIACTTVYYVDIEGLAVVMDTQIGRVDSFSDADMLCHITRLCRKLFRRRKDMEVEYLMLRYMHARWKEG